MTAYIVEDDVENIELLKLLIKKYFPNIEIIGEASDANDFVKLLLSNQADIIFLDIDLGEQKNSLEIINEFENINAEIIITSSSEEYAINAMNDYNIISYVLKPLNIIYLNKAIIKSINKIALKEKENLYHDDNAEKNIIAIPDLTTIEIIDVKNIIHIEADGKYTVFHFSDTSTKTVSKNIGSFYDKLPKKMFVRIHHKHIININETETIFRSDGHYCLLKNGKTLPIAKRRVDELRKFLQLK